MITLRKPNTAPRYRGKVLLLTSLALMGWASKGQCAGKAPPPVLVRRVDPVYPDKALKDKLEGAVRVDLTISAEGVVTDAKVVKSDHKIFNAAALEAVKKWKYKKAKASKSAPAAPVHTLVIVSFKPPHAIAPPPAAVRETQEVGEPPEVISRVDPIYPADAKRNHVQGLVILKISITEQGNVTAAQVVRSDSILLNNSAIVAVMKWKYRITDAQRKRSFPISHTVTVRFVE